MWYFLIAGLLSVKGKVREFFKKSGKIIDVVKVSEKSGNSVFRFIVHKSSSRLWNAFSFGKDEKYAAKQAKRLIWHSTPDTCSSWGQWFSLSRKEVENEEKNIDGLQKKLKQIQALIVSHWYKVSENCLKVSEKSGESEGIFNFLMSGSTILKRLCDGCLVLYFVNFVNDSVLYVVNVNVSEKLLDVNDKKKNQQSTSIILVSKMYLPSRNLHQTLIMITKKFGKL